MELLKLAQGLAEQTGKRLLQVLHISLNGDFPERKRHYSASLFRSLQVAHQA